MHRFFIFYCLSLFISVSLFLIGALFLVEPPVSAEWVTEDNFVEALGATFLGLISIFALGLFFKRRQEIWVLFAILMGAACCRELDLHKAFTTDSFLKSKFYVREDIPMVEKIIGVSIIAALLICLYRLSKFIPTWIRDLLQFKPPALSVFIGLGLLAIAKVMDSLKRLVPALHDFHVENAHTLQVIEESFETAGAAMFLCICFLALRTNQPSHQG